ncbi:cyclin-I-like isoform X1 [Dermacentor andersoni]|uniref:cyclin-I-like isoform X1 n=2 Tax=Dermacentor andersoni TaxID=34620 RepID=UPI0021554F3E|nr:cyclin-I-like [Dermacentor andersoni]
MHATRRPKHTVSMASLKQVRFAASAAAMPIQAGLTADSAIALVQRYLGKERLHWRPCTYASQGEEITPVQRNHTVKWLTVLNRYLRFNPETLFLSVTLMDEFLRLVRAQPKYLKCIAISCFYLASKIIEEDEVVPHIKDLIKNCDCIFSVSEITRMEALILKKLRWDLCRATSLDFLHGFYALLVLNRSLLLPDQSEQQLAALGPLLETKLQICLDQASLVGTRPSTLALALVSLELETWTPNWFVITIALQRLAKVENSDVIRCREELACIFIKARTAVSRKHRHSDSQSAHKPSKRRMETTDIEDIYDSIKRLYGEETTSTTSSTPASISCGMHQGQGGISVPGFPVRAM